MLRGLGAEVRHVERLLVLGVGRLLEGAPLRQQLQPPLVGAHARLVDHPAGARSEADQRVAWRIKGGESSDFEPAWWQVPRLWEQSLWLGGSSWAWREADKQERSTGEAVVARCAAV